MILPRMYTSLSEWWPLLSSPAEYEEEAAIYAGHLISHGDQPALSLVEFGSGGGNNASHMKGLFHTTTLVDPAPGMLAISRQLNPECEHFEGDMRSMRLGREFDRVFIHDAICYMTTIEDLRAAIRTAFVHCRNGGAVLLAPDFTRESFRPGTDVGGHDGEERGLRFLEWVWDPDPADTTYIADYAYLLREGSSIRVEHDRHFEGLFSRDEWIDLMIQTGFRTTTVPLEHSDLAYKPELFIGVKPVWTSCGGAFS